MINLVPSEVEIERWYTAARLCGDTNACPLLIAAAEKGSHLAEACLTILYTHGCNGLAKDADNALVYAQRSLPWLLAEVAKGNRYAQYLLGFCYFDGTGVSKNELEAIRLFKMAADQGFANAQCYLGEQQFLVFHVKLGNII